MVEMLPAVCASLRMVAASALQLLPWQPLSFDSPFLEMALNPVDMIFDYNGTYTGDTPEAYETLLLDTMLGDQTLFMRGDQVEAAWDLLMPILNAWSGKKSLSFLQAQMRKAL